MYKDLVLEHLHLLQRMGWWSEAEGFLRQHYSQLPEQEAADWLEYLQEKKRIYQGEAEYRPNGLSYIGADDIVQLQKGRVTVSYHIKDRLLQIEHIYRSLIKAMELVSETLQYEPREVGLHLHGQDSEILDESLGEAVHQASIIGIYDDCLRLKSKAFYHQEPQKISVIITHEYIHKAVADLSRQRAPRWLDEGLAVSLSQELPLEYAQILDLAVREEAYFPCQALEGDSLFLLDRQASALAYAQSCSLVQFLCQKTGWEGVRSILEHLGSSSSMQQALQRYSLNYFLLEKEWQRWLRREKANSSPGEPQMQARSKTLTP